MQTKTDEMKDRLDELTDSRLQMEKFVKQVFISLQ